MSHENSSSDVLRADGLLSPYYGLPPLHPTSSSSTTAGTGADGQLVLLPLEQLGDERRDNDLLSYNALRNSMLPINRLPPELLVAVMYCLQTLLRSNEDYYSWLKTLLVCRHWFVIGSTAPSLWRSIFIFTDSVNLGSIIHTALARSKNAPLSFAVQTSYSSLLVFSDSTIHELVAPHSHRIRELNLRQVSFSAVTTLLLRDMPSLEILYINLSVGERHNDSGSDSDDGFHRTIPPPLKAIEFAPVRLPRLQSLSLHTRTTYFSNIEICDQLCTLRLGYRREIDHKELGILIAIVKKCANLIALYVSTDSRSTPDVRFLPPFPTPSAVIYLSKLREVFIQIQPHMTKHIFSAIRMPSDAHVTFVWPANRLNSTLGPPSLAEGLPADLSHLPVLQKKSIHTAFFEICTSHRRLAMHSGLPDSDYCDSRYGNAPASSIFGVDLSHQYYSSHGMELHSDQSDTHKIAIDDFLTLTSATPLTTLSITVDTFYATRIDWLALLQPLDILQTLTVNAFRQAFVNSAPFSVRTLFGALDGSAEYKRTSEAICPALRELRIGSFEASYRSEMQEELAHARECLERRGKTIAKLAVTVGDYASLQELEEDKEWVIEAFSSVVGEVEYVGQCRRRASSSFSSSSGSLICVLRPPPPPHLASSSSSSSSEIDADS